MRAGMGAKMQRTIASLIFGVCFANFHPAIAADPCDAVLVVTTIQNAENSRTALAALNLVDQSNYSVVKSGLGLSARVPVEGVPVDFSTNWDQFKEARDQYRRLTKTDYTEEHSRSYSMVGLTDAQMSAWLDCKKTASGNDTVVLGASAATSTYITLTGVWIKDNTYAPDAIQVTGNPANWISGADFVSQPDAEWKNRVNVIFRIKPHIGEDISVNIPFVQGKAAKFTLPWSGSQKIWRASPFCVEQAPDREECTKCIIPAANFRSVTIGNDRRYSCRMMRPNSTAAMVLSGDFRPNTALDRYWISLGYRDIHTGGGNWGEWICHAAAGHCSRGSALGGSGSLRVDGEGTASASILVGRCTVFDNQTCDLSFTSDSVVEITQQ
jgi:hypothetical protein